jgi:CRISPR-associated protein Cas5d
MASKYEVQLEIAGPAAMFTRPDSGAAFVSYPAPTYSASKGIFESVARLKSAYISPLRVEICRQIQFQRYTTNYGGPLRHPSEAGGPNSFQHHAVILADVCYRLYGVIEEAAPSPTGLNHLHALQEMFNRRLANGQCYSMPCLGWREFVPTYVGPFRPETQVNSSLDLEIPSMLHHVFDKPVAGKHAPEFRRNARVTRGVLSYAE